MYLHKKDRNLFRNIIFLTSDKMKVPFDIVEKDYYVTMILRLLSNSKYDIVFKGGTSLSKAFRVIDRFSEDIDITFTEHLGEKKRKKLKYEILKPIEEELNLYIQNWDHIESNKDYNHYDYCYDTITDNKMDGLSPYVKLETALMSYAFPTEKTKISNYIYEALADEEPDLLETYNLLPFEMRVQSLERTLIDKIFALCDYYLLHKAQRNSRHLYDIYKLAPYIKKNKVFLNLVEEVKSHRAKMDIKITPSARANVDIKEIIQKIYLEDFYKSDYNKTTKQLISDHLDYKTTVEFYLQFTKDLF